MAVDKKQRAGPADRVAFERPKPDSVAFAISHEMSGSFTKDRVQAKVGPVGPDFIYGRSSPKMMF
jgi:hypothetical protein